MVAHATIAALRVLDIKRGRKARLPALSSASALQKEETESSLTFLLCLRRTAFTA